MAPVDVQRIDRAPSGFLLHAERGTISATRVVYAVGYASDQYRAQPVGDLNCTYVSTSRPTNRFDGWPNGCLIWETARPYFYARQTDDGRVIIGAPSTDEFVKRVIGLPGEVVEGRDGAVYVNGRRLVEPYLRSGVATQAFGPTTVPPGHVWVMGDNRSNSADSRVFGPVQESSIVGRAVVRVWPVPHAAFL